MGKLGPPTQLFYKGEMVSTPQRLANSINSFFVDKAKGLLGNLPLPTGDPLEPLCKLMEPRTCSFQLKPVHPDEVLEIV